MLLTPDEREEWVDKVVPPGVKKRFKGGQEAERRDRANNALIEVCGAVGQIREELAARTEAERKAQKVAKHYAKKYKEANEVLKLRNTEKKTLMQEKEEVEKTKDRLEQQVQEVSQEKEDQEEKIEKVNEFWMEQGAEKMVGTCLKSPELYQWLLRFGGTILNIGKTQGAAAVFAKYGEDTEYWQDKKVEDVPGCARGMIYKGTYIDDKIRMLQAGRIRFQFLEYLAANPGVDRHELENLGYYAYKTLADGAKATSSTAATATGEGIDFEDKSVKQLVPVEATTTEGPGIEKEEGAVAEDGEKDTGNVAEVATETEPEVGTNEGPGNAGVV